jgi:hypothetical protein
LSYSERVRHAADGDGRYPFRVVGYRIRAVGRASGRTIVLRLVETAAADDAARPPVRYARTRAGVRRVVDRARNQAASQVFRATRPHRNRPAPTQQPTNQPPPPAQPSPAADRDADGVPDAEDCAPADPAAHPGAPDQPDLAFVDSNCDAIDGTENDAVFVSAAFGEDTNPGTPAAPKREIQAGVVTAALAGKDVYVGNGEYDRVETASGVDIYGGYFGTTWERNVDARTRIVGRPEAVLASGDRVLLQLVTVVGLGSGPGSSAYGLRAVAGSNIALERVTSVPSGGVPGMDGIPGAAGFAGSDGGRGEAGACDTEVGGNGGAPGASPAGFPGGRGGRGGLERLRPQGLPGLTGTVGTPGGAGGANGSRGSPGRPARAAYQVRTDAAAQSRSKWRDGVPGKASTAPTGRPARPAWAEEAAAVAAARRAPS